MKPATGHKRHKNVGYTRTHTHTQFVPWRSPQSYTLPISRRWLATRQHEPIHMWDAFDGSLRCSYSGYDAVDEVMAAISLAFSHDGEQIYAGYKRCIKIFDTSR